MKYLTIILAQIIATSISFGQNPGNLGTTNISAWFTPESLTNGDIHSWTTTYPNGASAITVNDNSAPYPLATETPTNDVSNYNRTLEFLNNDLTSLKGLENTNSMLNLINNASSGDQGTFFCAYYLPTSTSNDHMLLYNSPTNDGLQLRNLGTKGRLAIGTNMYTSTNASRDWTETFRPSIASYTGNRGSYNSMTTFTDGALFTGGVASQSSGANGLYMGYMPGNNNSPYNGYLHEFIFYNRDLTTVEISKVNTYLAIKYGVTLNNDAGGTNGDYISASGTTIWDASLNSDYHHDVVGIAREDSQNILQKQSHSFDDTTRIYVGNLETSNNTNSASISNDISFIMIGHNAGQLCGTSSALAEIPNGQLIQSRLEREWKITNTNFTDNFGLDIKLKNCLNPTANDISKIKVLIDDDGDFSDALVFSSSDLGISINGGMITINDLTNQIIPNNSTRYLTIAYSTPVIDFALDRYAICEGDSLKMIFSVSNGQSTDLAYTDGSNTFQLANISNGDFIYLTPNSSTNYTLQSGSPFLNCCSNGNNGNTVSVIVYSLPSVQAHTSKDTVCYGESITLFGSGATNYSWDNQVIDSQLFIPTETATYSLEGTDNNGCKNVDQINITVAPETSIDLGDDVSICPEQQITLGLDQSFSNYLWNDGSTEATISIDYDGTFQLTVTDEFYCSYTDSIQVLLLERCSELLFIPNVFTPNNDGDNDYFIAYGTGITQITITIYNRWGNIVYTSEELDFAWDGSNLNGASCNDGVYVYTIFYSYDGIEFNNATGHVTIIR